MTEMMNQLEQEVLEKLLAGDHPVLAALRRQLGSCVVRKREYTGCGFFTELQPERGVAPAPTSRETVWFGDVEAEIQGLEHGAGFVLRVNRGMLALLEGYSYDEPWPEEIRLYTLTYTGGSRDIGALNLDLEARG